MAKQALPAGLELLLDADRHKTQQKEDAPRDTTTLVSPSARNPFPQPEDALASLAVYQSDRSRSGQSDAGSAVPVIPT